jgi:hypothetical protein
MERAMANGELFTKRAGVMIAGWGIVSILVSLVGAGFVVGTKLDSKAEAADVQRLEEWQSATDAHREDDKQWHEAYQKKFDDLDRFIRENIGRLTAPKER